MYVYNSKERVCICWYCYCTSIYSVNAGIMDHINLWTSFALLLIGEQVCLVWLWTNLRKETGRYWQKNSIGMSRLILVGQIGILAKSVCRGAIYLCHISGHFYTPKYSTYVRYLCLNPEFFKKWNEFMELNWRPGWIMVVLSVVWQGFCDHLPLRLL